jgi:hypothetical protein
MISMLAVSGTNLAMTGSVPTAPPMEKLMVFGFLVSVVALLFYGYQAQGPACVLGLGICLAAMAVYGFLQGAWPAGILLIVLAAETIWRWRREKRFGGWIARRFPRPRAPMPVWKHSSRISGLYGHIKSGGNFN